jgi:hypothetical protein
MPGCWPSFYDGVKKQTITEPDYKTISNAATALLAQDAERDERHPDQPRRSLEGLRGMAVK